MQKMPIIIIILTSLLGIAVPATSDAAFAQAFLDASNFREEASKFKVIMSKPLDEQVRLAASGDPYAQAAMGSRHMVGDGVELNFAKAFRFYEISAEQGNLFGEEALGNAYYTGRGTETDY